MSENGQPGPWGSPDDKPRVIKGPWARAKAKPFRRPVAKPRRGRREPIVNNWRMLIVFGLLIFVAPPVARWLVQVIGGLLVR